MVIGFISKLVRTITLSKVVVWGLTALLCISLYTIYENRSKLVSWFAAPDISNVIGLTFQVGPETRQRLDDLVGKNPEIIGVSVMSADLRLNETRYMFFAADDASLAALFDFSINSDTNRLPLFTSLEENNAEIIKLINGQFTCTDFNLTIESRLYPKSNDAIKTICRTSIPSYYGYFSGFLQLYLSEQPNNEKQLQYKLIVEKISNDIYFKDVLPTQRPEKIKQSRGVGL